MSDSAANSTSRAPSAPLGGIRVLDFTHVLAGPFCTRLLADLGADVVRVESGKHPDFPWPSKYKHSDGRHASYLNTNRSKRSIAIDLKQQSGRDIAARLAAVADVVVENFSAGVMARFKLDYDTLRPLNPRLIFASLSGYGHNGPRRDWTSMNMNLQGYGGLMLVTGKEGDPPIAISNSWNDYIGGLHGCFAIIEALGERERTGAGACLDLSQFECSVSMIGPAVLASAVNRRAPARMGNRDTKWAPQGVYRCAGEDEWCAITVKSDEQWRALTVVIGAEDLLADSRFATVSGRITHHDQIDRRIEAWTCSVSSAGVESRLAKVGVPAERMRRVRDVVDDPQRSQAFTTMPEPRVGTMLTTTLPLKLSVSPLATFRPAPSLGEHSEIILREWLDLSGSEIEKLRQQEALV
jgi:benzylsuccinate CoA-transferase BbsF subunit